MKEIAATVICTWIFETTWYVVGLDWKGVRSGARARARPSDRGRERVLPALIIQCKEVPLSLSLCLRVGGLPEKCKANAGSGSGLFARGVVVVGCRRKGRNGRAPFLCAKDCASIPPGTPARFSQFDQILQAGPNGINTGNCSIVIAVWQISFYLHDTTSKTACGILQFPALNTLYLFNTSRETFPTMQCLSQAK